MEGVEFRQVRDEDTEVLYDLHVRGLKESGSFIPNPEGRDVFDKDFLNLREHYLGNKGEFLVVETNGKIIGMGALQKVDETTGEIKRMRIEKEYQGKGLGKTMLEKLIQRAKELGYKRLTLDTSTNQIPAQRLYESFGFKEYKREPFHNLVVVHYERNV